MNILRYVAPTLRFCYIRAYAAKYTYSESCVLKSKQLGSGNAQLVIKLIFCFDFFNKTCTLCCQYHFLN